MLRIRLSRFGSNKRAHYRIVVADAKFRRDGKYIEKIGFYSPILPKDSEKRVVLNSKERLDYWLSVGAEPSDSVARILKLESHNQKVKRIIAAKKSKEEKAAKSNSQKNTNKAEKKDS